MVTLAIRKFKSATIADYLSLAKPRGILPHLITAAAAMLLAAGATPPVSTLVFTLIGGGCVAAAANIFNSYFDRDIDALMLRTRHRPLPSGQLKPAHALVLGVIIGLCGVLILSEFVNRSAALLAVLALAYYVLPYTLWLKRRTYWSTIIGSGIGALPPVIGWIAVTNRIEITPFLLSAIIILWTVPHFWTLATYRRNEYEQAGLKVLPARGTIIWITACSISLAVISLLVTPIAGLGVFYLTVAGILNIGFLSLMVRMNLKTSLSPSRWFYYYSIFYITFLFAGMIIERLAFS